MRSVFQSFVKVVPPGIIRWLGRLQFQFPTLGPVIRKMGRAVTSGPGRIQHGPGAGLLIDATLGFPGYLTGTTEPEEQMALSHLLKKGNTFWNIGANVGFHAILGARFVGPLGRVVAFEPSPEIASAARANAALNLFSWMHVVEKAVSSSNGPVTLFMAEGSAVSTLERSRLEDGCGLEVDAVTLDDFVSGESKLPNLVSIDVEGAEIFVLLGALKLLKKCRPKLLIELHWLQAEFYEFFDRELEPLGYRLYGLGFDPYVRKTSSVREHLIAQVG